MKSGNITRKVGRLTYSACALLFASGLFSSCDDELLTGMPSWLGDSIYEELNRRGNFTTTLRLIDDEEVSNKDANGETANANTLKLTGSKTLFVANDEAYAEFFKQNSWGVKSYEELSQAQKRLLFNSSIVNSAYLIELLGNLNTSSMGVNSCLRRTTATSIWDSVPRITAKDMPNNEYWAQYRERFADGGANRMVVMMDDNVNYMNHFLPKFMTAQKINDNDLSVITNGACTTIEEAYVNGQRIVNRDITCQNGYIQEMAAVTTPLDNMAAMIRQNPKLTIFSGILDRFAVPYNPILEAGDRSLTNTYNQNVENEALKTDTVFVLRYLNHGFKEDRKPDDASSNHSLMKYRGTNVTVSNGVLPYDPGWNSYSNGAVGTTAAEDMAAIFAPTDDAFNEYFTNGRGRTIYERYGNDIKNIPNHIMAEIMSELMRNSMLATVPSKFNTVMNGANKALGATVASIDSTMMASNGVVYVVKEVYGIPAFQVVSYPALIWDELSIMKKAITEYHYDAYLGSLDSEYKLLLPSNEALKHYVDPVDYYKNQRTITEFFFDAEKDAIDCNRYYAQFNEATGQYEKVSEEPIPEDDLYNTISKADYIEDRMTDILENSIIVRNFTDASARYWITKGNNVIELTNTGANTQFITPFNRELANEGKNFVTIKARETHGYYDLGTNEKGGNGECFIIDAQPVMTATKTVTQVIQEKSAADPRFEEFYNIIQQAGLTAELFGAKTETGSTSTTYKYRANGPAFECMENYNYTVYVPTSESIKALYTSGALVDYRDIKVKEDELAALPDDDEHDSQREQLETEIEAMRDELADFVKYHIQNNSIYLNGASNEGVTNAKFNTSYLDGANNRLAALSVQAQGDSYNITCMDSRGNLLNTGNPRKVLEGNWMAREYRFAAGLANAENWTYVSEIYNSSFAVVHLIDGPLLYSQDMWDKAGN